ncbi:MAG: glutamate racemase, partial [Candidatus Nitrosomaritimum aestuariumsis]
LVESGKFISNKKYCQNIIKKYLDEIISQHNIDTITLSSTHLPFLKLLLKKQYPKINFIDPADIIAAKVFLKIKNKQTKRNTLKIFASGNVKTFQTKLNKLGINNKVTFLSS